MATARNECPGFAPGAGLGTAPLRGEHSAGAPGSNTEDWPKLAAGVKNPVTVLSRWAVAVVASPPPPPPRPPARDWNHSVRSGRIFDHFWVKNGPFRPVGNRGSARAPSPGPVRRRPAGCGLGRGLLLGRGRRPHRRRAGAIRVTAPTRPLAWHSCARVAASEQ